MRNIKSQFRSLLSSRGASLFELSLRGVPDRWAALNQQAHAIRRAVDAPNTEGCELVETPCRCSPATEVDGAARQRCKVQTRRRIQVPCHAGCIGNSSSSCRDVQSVNFVDLRHTHHWTWYLSISMPAGQCSARYSIVEMG